MSKKKRKKHNKNNTYNRRYAMGFGGTYTYDITESGSPQLIYAQIEKKHQKKNEKKKSLKDIQKREI